MSFCSSCGNEIKDETNFCNNCGKALKGKGQEQGQRQKVFPLLGKIFIFIIISSFVLSIFYNVNTGANNNHVSVPSNKPNIIQGTDNKDEKNLYGSDNSEIILEEKNYKSIHLGNLINAGYFAIKGEKIFYSDMRPVYNNSTGKSDIYGSLVKSNIDGSDKQILVNDAVLYINIVGDWIYYINVSDGSKIYKDSINGQTSQKVNDESSSELIVQDDWVYYVNDDDNGTIYKMKLDGSIRTKLNNDCSKSINVVNDWIYYSNNSDGNKIYKIDQEGKNKQKLNNQESYRLNVFDDWIYFRSNQSICRMKTDGSNNTIIVNKSSGLNLNVYQNKLYFDTLFYFDTESLQITSGLIKADLNGSNKEFIVRSDENPSEMFLGLSLFDDWIYYSGNDGLYRIKNDGNFKSVISEY